MKKKSLLFCLCLIASKHSAFPPTKVSASEVPAILNNVFQTQKRWLWRPLFWNSFSSRVGFMWCHSVQLGIGRKKKNMQLTLHPPQGQENLFSFIQANIHFTIFSAIILEIRAFLTQNNFIVAQEQPYPRVVVNRLVGSYLDKISWKEWRHENAAWLLSTVQNGGSDVKFWASFNEMNVMRKTCT